MLRRKDKARGHTQNKKLRRAAYDSNKLMEELPFLEVGELPRKGDGPRYFYRIKPAKKKVDSGNRPGLLNRLAGVVRRLKRGGVGAGRDNKVSRRD